MLLHTPTGSRQKIRGTVVHPAITSLSREFLEEFDIILFDRHEKLAYDEVTSLKSPNTKILIDTSVVVSDHTMRMLRSAGIPIVPIEFLERLSGSRDLAHCHWRVRRETLKDVLVTLGENGCMVSTSDGYTVVPPVDITAVDVTGAGDVYRGAVAFGILQKWDLLTTAQFANAVAAQQCLRIGNYSAIPTKEACLELIDLHKTAYCLKA